ncbi:MAG: ribosome silencing factor [Pseudomonadota bacterium]
MARLTKHPLQQQPDHPIYLKQKKTTMNIQQLQALVVDALEDVKAQDIQVFDTTHLSNMFDRLAIASGTSNRQTRALASSVHDKVKAAGGQVIGMEGGDTGEWVLVDLGDMVVHIMQAPIRAYYRLEELWGDKPVSLEVARKGLKAAKAGKASAEADDEAATPAKPKRTSRRNDSTTEALKPEPPVRKSRSKAALEDGEAPAPAKRARKPAASAGDAAAPAKRSRAAAGSSTGAATSSRSRKPAASSDAAPAVKTPRPRKPRVADAG